MGYLKFNGVDASVYLSGNETLMQNVRKVELDLLLEERKADDYIFSNLSFSMRRLSWRAMYIYGIDSVYFNDVLQGLYSVLPVRERFKLTANNASSYLMGIRFFANGYSPNSIASQFAEGRLYGVKLYNASGELISSFNFEEGNLVDQTGSLTLTNFGAEYIETSLPAPEIELKATFKDTLYLAGKRTGEIELKGKAITEFKHEVKL